MQLWTGASALERSHISDQAESSMPTLAQRAKQFLRVLAYFVASALCWSVACPLNAQVKMNVSTQPSTGVAGTTVINAVGSGFPTAHGTINPNDVTVFLSGSCGGPP